MYVRQTGSGINFQSPLLLWKIAVMSNISKTVTDTMMGSIEVKYETIPGLSIGTTTLNLRWPWTVLDLGDNTCTSNIDTMLDTMEVLWETINELPISTMTFDLEWRWTVLVQGQRNYTSNISKNGDRYHDWVNRSRIGNHPRANNWQHDLWPWMTLNRPRSRSQNFLVKYLEYEGIHNVGLKKGQIGNHQCTFDWPYVLWSWMTLNWPTLRSLKGHQILRKWWQIQWLCQWKSNRKPPVRSRLASWPLTLDDIEPS